MSINKGLSIYKYGAGGVTPEDVEELIAQNGKGAFIAEYGVTSYEDVTTALYANKTLFVKTIIDGNTVFGVYTDWAANEVHFTSFYNNKIYDIYVVALLSNHWRMNTVNIDSPILQIDNNTYFDDIARTPDNFNNILKKKIIVVNLSAYGYMGRIFAVLTNYSYYNEWLGFSYIPSDTGDYNNTFFSMGYFWWHRNSSATKGGTLNITNERNFVFPSPSGSAHSFFYYNGSYIVWKNENDFLFVPTTSGHYNQTLRSKNDGSYGWEPTINEIRLYYDSTWKVDKNYTDIKSLINLDRPVRTKLEVGTNDNIYLDFVRDYTNSGTQATDYLIFQKNIIDVAAGSMDCYTLKIMGDSTISYTHTIYTM